MEIGKIKQEMYSSIAQWQSSGMSQAAWSKLEGYSRSKFKHWLNKYRKEHGHVERQSNFVNVEIDQSPSRDGHYSIHYPNGVRIECSGHLPISQLKQLINLVKS